jgi:hypothetical protein
VLPYLMRAAASGVLQAAARSLVQGRPTTLTRPSVAPFSVTNRTLPYTYARLADGVAPPEKTPTLRWWVGDEVGGKAPQRRFPWIYMTDEACVSTVFINMVRSQRSLILAWSRSVRGLLEGRWFAFVSAPCRPILLRKNHASNRTQLTGHTCFHRN